MKKKQNTCDLCKYKSDIICMHPKNEGIVVKYRVEKSVFFKTCIELNPDGDCKNYAEFPKK